MTVSKVFEICNAYETGVGHGQKKDGHTAGPYSDPELNEAYEMGYSLGFAISEAENGRTNLTAGEHDR